MNGDYAKHMGRGMDTKLYLKLWRLLDLEDMISVSKLSKILKITPQHVVQISNSLSCHNLPIYEEKIGSKMYIGINTHLSEEEVLTYLMVNEKERL